MICLGEGCETCQPPAKKKAPRSAATAATPSPSTAPDPTPTVPAVDFKAAMKAAVVKSTPTSAAKTTTDSVAAVDQPTETQATLSEEELDALAVLYPILHPDELKPYQSELWKRRRGNAV